MGGRGFSTTWPTGRKNEQEGGGDKIQNLTEPNEGSSSIRMLDGSHIISKIEKKSNWRQVEFNLGTNKKTGGLSSDE